MKKAGEQTHTRLRSDYNGKITLAPLMFGKWSALLEIAARCGVSLRYWEQCVIGSNNVFPSSSHFANLTSALELCLFCGHVPLLWFYYSCRERDAFRNYLDNAVRKSLTAEHGAQSLFHGTHYVLPRFHSESTDVTNNINCGSSLVRCDNEAVCTIRGPWNLAAKLNSAVINFSFCTWASPTVTWGRPWERHRRLQSTGRWK